MKRKPEMHVMELWNAQIVCSLLYVAAPILMNVLMKVSQIILQNQIVVSSVFLIPTFI